MITRRTKLENGRPSTHDIPVTEKQVKAKQVETSRSYLASHIRHISTQEGWWYRLPSSRKSKVDTDANPDDVMPHLGVVLGLPESAAVALFMEMDLLTTWRGRTCINNNRWDDLIATYMLKDVVEVSPTRFLKHRHTTFVLGSKI